MRMVKSVMMVLIALGAISASASANLVVNGGFNENWDGWTPTGQIDWYTLLATNEWSWTNHENGVTYTPKEGTYLGKLISGPAASWNWIGMYQDVPLTPGTTYDFSVWSAAIQYKSGTEVDVGLLDADKNRTRWVYNNNREGPAANDWLQEMATFTAGDTEVYARIYLVYSGKEAPADWAGAYYDNVQLNAVPEPVTLGLLSLGGLILRRRK